VASRRATLATSADHRASWRTGHAAAIFPGLVLARPTQRRAVVVAALGLFVPAAACVDVQPAERAQRGDGEPRRATAAANGFNDAIAWRALDEGLDEAKRLGRPLMLVVHASWCGKCRALKPSFADADLAALSEQFVMVNVDQDQTPRSTQYAPDGTYVPRIVFLDPQSGRPDETLLNASRRRYVYYYAPGDDLVGVMRKALERYGQS
jgi:protein-disulfide reductase (glutathione)